ncbi:MAG: helix-turn-helix domain-containing protein [Bacillota bacterium]
MILADKIIENRKKNGWSQEELAEKLGVSRQSVSKWEGAQAIPDMKKILQLAELFGVTTDYLLKDEIEDRPEMAIEPVDRDLVETVRSVSIEEANAFLDHNAKAARTISTGVMLCILSPIILILLLGAAATDNSGVSEYTAIAVGVCVLIIMAAIAVAMFLSVGMRGKRFEYLEELNIETEYGVSGMVKERQDRYSETHSRMLIVGIVLCIIAVIPVLIMSCMSGMQSPEEAGLPILVSVAVLLALVSVGVKMIVLTCTINGGYDKLLEEGDYTRLNKKVSRNDGIYWIIVLAIYFAWSFITGRWELTWIVWPIAGVLYGLYREIQKVVIRSKNK